MKPVVPQMLKKVMEVQRKLVLEDLQNGWHADLCHGGEAVELMNPLKYAGITHEIIYIYIHSLSRSCHR